MPSEPPPDHQPGGASETGEAAASFDLITEPWLPAQHLDGTEAELSLLGVFEQAHRVRRLVGDLPTQEFALLRLLLAILHDALDGPADPEEWADYWEDDRLPADRVREYLAAHRHRFDLLHPLTPFFQVAGLHTAKGDMTSLDRIVADVPANDRFFTMRARGADRLTPAEAARWVVHAHAYDPSGIKSGAVGDPRVKGGKGYPQGVGWSGNLGGVFAEGDTLRDTLLLNLIATDTANFRADSDDRPAWRREPSTAAQAGAVELATRPSGVRDLYTWQTRRIRLHHDADGIHGVLLCYGDPLTPRNMHYREPMTAWRRSPAQEKKHKLPQVYLPREHDPARTAWRGLGALVAGQVRGAEQRQEAAAVVRPRILDWIAGLTVEGFLPQDYLIRARLVGARYGTQQSVIDDVIDDSVPLPVVLLHDRDRGLGQAAIDAVTDADSAIGVLGDLASDIAVAAGADTDGPRDKARDLGFGELDAPFRTWLAEIRPGQDPQERRRDWQRQARRLVSSLGDQLVDNAPQAAWDGRIVATGNGSHWLTAASAQLWFHRRLRKALPLAAAPDADTADADDIPVPADAAPGPDTPVPDADATAEDSDDQNPEAHAS
ncbi:type I-E CRISPR-associated protein Cse1/CasA [Streptomyces sodiiphilus]|uniref:Type I-E CRISPR-associated protein Cse1/CasA n=1 Tax=Streptomyces sodiiphilus TaxID=226217 RepID=A0ABN2PLS9_9ACTN